MSAEELEELAIAYLLGELPEDEHASFEARLQGEPELSAKVEELERTLGLTALSQTELVEPASGLRDSILDAVTETEQQPADDQGETKNSIAFFPAVAATVGWAAAAVLIFLNFKAAEKIENLDENLAEARREVAELDAEQSELEKSNSQLESRVTTLSEQLETTVASNAEILQRLQSAEGQLANIRSERDELQTMVAQLREQSTLDKVQIAGLRSEIDQLQYGITVWDTEQDSGVVKVFNLPELDTPTQDYQLWVISKDDPAPISAGVFQVDSQGNAEYRFGPDRPVSAVKAFAVSREKKGGSVSPEGQIMLSGAL